ncbi:MAG: Trk system potassium transporter TrkA [Oscillospiraceae bacterium]|nr:Trk system potassium transporter TrkA [Oscillospiraceae bacterium]
MRIILVGCGKIGVALLSVLVAEGHDVVAMDSRSDLLETMNDRYDVMCVSGSGADCEALLEAGVEKTDLLIAVTGSDELNMLICYLARRQGAKHTIARIRNPQYNDKSLGFLREQLGLSMPINPEFLTAQEIHHILKLPAASKVETFSRRNFEMVEIRLKEDSPFVGHKLEDLRGRFKAMFLVCAVQRGNEVVIPRGDYVLEIGDRIGITADRVELWKLFKTIGLAKKQARNVLLLGGSRIAFYLSKLLLNSGSNVKLIDTDKATLHKFSDVYPAIETELGDGTHPEVLQEARLQDQDAFVCLTGMDEENILAAYYARAQHVGQVIAKVNIDEMAKMAAQMGLENVVSPKAVVVSVVLRYVRALQSSMGSSSIENLYQLMDGKAEALEFIVSNEAAYTGIPLKDLRLKKNILIAGLLRDRKAIIPAGNDMILPGDRVVVIAGQQRLNTLADILL